MRTLSNWLLENVITDDDYFDSMVDLLSHKSQFEEFSKKILDELSKSNHKDFVLRQPQSLHDGILSSITENFIREQKSYSNILSVLSNSEITQMYGNEPEYLLARFIYKLIIENKDSDLEWFQYNSSIFEKIFNAFIKELLEPNWIYSTCCIMLNFKSNTDSIKIDNDIKIEKFGTWKLKDFMGWNERQFNSFSETEKEIIFQHPFVLMICEKIKKEPNNRVMSNSPSSYNIMDNLLTALRLYKAGDASTGNFFYSRRSEFFNFVGVGYSWTSAPKFLHQFGQGYLLVKDKIEDFIKFRIKINDFIIKNNNFNQILLPLRYFNSTYRSYDQPDDRLIDCITSLEALFKIDSELAFKLSFRISHLLSKSDEEKTRIFSDIKKFYNTRNHLVHGSNLKDKDKKNIRNVENLVSYVRSSLKAFINLAIEGKLTNQFYEEMDIILMNNMERANIQKIIFQT